ncbi:hypothetical protein [Desulfosarcina sp.]|uniref:hypothetical protein n=1 Tax=Desulfosarcina sp. TaxID=2027861 RepID=UPI003970835C
MDKNNYENSGQESTGEPGNSGAKTKSTLERGAEAFGHAEEAVSDAYDKTSEKVGENYNKAKNYIHDNPGKTILISLGIGVGIGLLLGGSTHRTRTGRLAQPVVHALSDIALAYFR